MHDDFYRGFGSLIANDTKVQCAARNWRLLPKSVHRGVNEVSRDRDRRVRVLLMALNPLLQVSVRLYPRVK